MKQFRGAQGFVISLVAVVGLAALFPVWGGPESPLPVSLLQKLGIFLVFFTQGVQLPGEALRRGAMEWRLHAVVQGATYLIFPLLTFLFLLSGLGDGLHPDLRIGVIYMSFLPTTITSAVALTSVANGNVSGALFNCTLSSVLGVFLVPILCVSFLQVGDGGAGNGLLPLLSSAMLLLLVPLGLGQLLRPLLTRFFSRHPALIRRFNLGVILFIVWGAFCESVLRKVWSGIPVSQLTVIGLWVVALLTVMSAGLWWGSSRFGITGPSRITALYCGSQKTLAMGLPMATLIFTPSSGHELSLILLPLLILHPAQLLWGSMLAPHLRALRH